MNGYGGDNRSFAGDLDPDSYRVRIDINFTNRSASDVAGFSHQNGVNVGQRSCDKLGLEFTGNSANVTFSAQVGGQDNLFGHAPTVQGNFTITLNKNGTISVTGDHTLFPSFEVWVSITRVRRRFIRTRSNPKVFSDRFSLSWVP
jgi:hypothetical protein